MSRFYSSKSLLAAQLILLLTCLICSSITLASIRIKRQASFQVSPPLASVSAGALAGVSSSSNGSGTNRRPSIQASFDSPLPSIEASVNQRVPETSISSQPSRPQISVGSSGSPTSIDQDNDIPERDIPVTRPINEPPKRPESKFKLRPRPRRPIERPTERPSRPIEDDTDEECDDDYHERDGPYDYKSMFHIVTEPMRHMSSMMSRMFDSMPGIDHGSGEYDGRNYAVSSSVSNSDGYSRLSSAVTNNGRTRGIVSETRNGRTKTRKIGDYEDEEYDQ